MQSIDYAYKILDLFQEEDAEIYLAGGSVRDYLLFGDFDDFDFATPCPPLVVTTILNIDKFDKFAFKFGSVKTTFQEKEIQITTFRKEGEYLDSRHPNSIKFIKDIQKDSERRDFTINALYLDYEGKILDFHNGLDDLEHHIIKTIGDASKRIKEDPTRILRAIRFKLYLNFSLDENLENAIKENKKLLNLISKERFMMEYNKMIASSTKEEIEELFTSLDLNLNDYLV